MFQAAIDITTHKLVEHDALLTASAHIFALKEFRDHVVHPSLTIISKKLDELSASTDDIAAFLVSDFEELKNSTIQGFMVAVQSMWERGLRAMLCICDSKMFDGALLEAIKKANWGDHKGSLQDHFQRLIGISMCRFTSYDDLNFLLILTNGIRHGDGPSATRLYALCPSLWPNACEPEQIPLFSEIVLQGEVLQQMIESILWFWEDIENIRCNSFERKAPVVAHKLSNWRWAIDQRVVGRVWNAL